jgi:hypothetical protein
VKAGVFPTVRSSGNKNEVIVAMRGTNILIWCGEIAQISIRLSLDLQSIFLRLVTGPALELRCCEILISMRGRKQPCLYVTVDAFNNLSQ